MKAVSRSTSGGISRSKPFKGASSSTHITFTPETLLFAAANYRQSKDVEVFNNGQSTIMFKMKSTSADIYRIRPVFFLLKPKEKRTVKVTFKGLPSDRALCQRDRITAVMAYSMTNSNDVKILWEKHRQIAHQPHSSSRKYIKIDFEDERRMSMARGATNSNPKTDISRLTSGEPIPASLPRPSGRVAHSGGRDASITHPNSTKKEQAIRPPSIHPNDLRPVKDVPPPLERLEPSLRTSIPLPPTSSEESKEETMDCIPPSPSIRSKTLPYKSPAARKLPPPPPTEDETEEAPPPPSLLPVQSKSKILPVKAPPSRKLAPLPPSNEDSKEETEEIPSTSPVQNKSKTLPLKTTPSLRLPVVSQSQENESVEDETSNLDDVPSLPQKDIPSLNPSGRKNVNDEESTQQQSIVYILYPGEEGKSKEEADEKDEDSKQ
ncbi:hypothetical protein PRIPAC_91139 [Pristionchus pacificus]|uniref:Major sperm protein n=1 Tax=Pristionchus pacificus TaxID=54126 RepID=A0A2A6BZ46_PRIPA|nr:hypothetical protein PRIPAC_91139 [Pristionchus pacificus]|eukprot:PDM71214.1 MSP domain-containing protein [Pristionchus pacificus]